MRPPSIEPTAGARPGAAPMKTAGDIGMATTVPFLRYELRRHVGPLALGLLLLAILPIARRLYAEDWGYWDGAWNVWGAVLALYVVMPVLVLAMTASGWARERAVDTLEWLYARPLSSGSIFAARAIAIATAALAWSAVALAVHGVGATELEQALSILPGLPGPAMLFVVQLALALGAGLLASTLAASAESAFRASALLATGAWAAALIASRSVPHQKVLLAASRSGVSEFLDTAIAIFLLAIGATMGAGAWLLVARGPLRSRLPRRIAAATASVAVAAIAGWIAVLCVPLASGERSPHALWLGGDSGLTFAAARGLGASAPDHMLFAHPVVRGDGEERVLHRTFAVRPGPWTRGPWPNPARGRAIVHAYLEPGWLLIDRDGHARRLPLDPAGTSHAIGWSPSGDRFAWKWVPWRAGGAWDSARWRDGARVVLLESDGSLRTILWPTALPLAARAAWIDDGALVLADADGSNDGAAGSWTVVSIEGPDAHPLRDLPAGQILAAPALTAWGSGAASALPRLGASPVALLVDADDPGTRLWSRSDAAPTGEVEAGSPASLVVIDAVSGTFELGPEVPIGTAAASFGNLDDGSLVFAARAQPLGPPSWGKGTHTAVYRLASAAAKPQVVCTMPDARIAHFVGHSGPWAIWDTILLLDYELWGCHLETGEVRRIVEWEPWAHSVATIGELGIWTPSGWVAMGGDRS